MTGICTASAIYRALLTISLMVNSPTSGKPRSAAVPAPVIYTAGKPTASAILACMALRINGATTMGPVCSSCRRLVVVFISVSLLHQVDAHTHREAHEGRFGPLPNGERPGPTFAASGAPHH